MLTTIETTLTPASAINQMRLNRMHRLRNELSNRRHPISFFYLRLKILIEWMISLALVVTTAPILLALTLVVRITSRGPAFYSQTRLGQNGRQYRMYKIRTMVHDAEAASGPVWASKEDARITPIGKILRDTHLDELPQLLNVLRGEMSLIGPRPERPELAVRIQQEIPEFHLRLLLRPGITGLAQMLLPADDPADSKLTGLRKKLSHDLYYIRHVGFLLDVKIYCSTACHFLAGAIDALRGYLVGSYTIAAQTEMCIDDISEESL